MNWFRLIIVVSCTSVALIAQALTTLVIGTTTVRIGMRKDIALAALSAQYSIKPAHENCTDNSNPVCREFLVWDGSNDLIATLQFDRDETLVKATVERIVGPQFHSEGEIGKALVAVIANLVTEGQQCVLETTFENSYDPKDPKKPVPDFGLRQGIVECGNKRLRILSVTQKGYPDSLQLTEEIGCAVEVVGGCDKK